MMMVSTIWLLLFYCSYSEVAMVWVGVVNMVFSDVDVEVGLYGG